MFTISFTDERLAAVNEVIKAFNARTGKEITIEQYLQFRANELADQAIYEYKIPPTRDAYDKVKNERDALQAEVEKLQAELDALKATSIEVPVLG
jgi:hypothetical protein